MFRKWKYWSSIELTTHRLISDLPHTNWSTTYLYSILLRYHVYWLYMWYCYHMHYEHGGIVWMHRGSQQWKYWSSIELVTHRLISDLPHTNWSTTYLYSILLRYHVYWLYMWYCYHMHYEHGGIVWMHRGSQKWKYWSSIELVTHRLILDLPQTNRYALYLYSIRVRCHVYWLYMW